MYRCDQLIYNGYPVRDQFIRACKKLSSTFKVSAHWELHCQDISILEIFFLQLLQCADNSAYNNVVNSYLSLDWQTLLSDCDVQTQRIILGIYHSLFSIKDMSIIEATYGLELNWTVFFVKNGMTKFGQGSMPNREMSRIFLFLYLSVYFEAS